MDLILKTYKTFYLLINEKFPKGIYMVLSSDGNPLISRKLILIHISGGLDSILIFIRHFLSVLKISKTFVFFLRIRYFNGSLKTDLKNGSLSISS